jgi:alcohol dehydrogenase (NADP+)
MNIKTQNATINPGLAAAVPYRILADGSRIPGIGLGTFGSDRVTGEEIAEAVRGAAAAGYRLIDCAAVYGNERLVGAALRDVVAAGIPRDQLWITSKLWNDKHAEQDVLPSAQQSLRDLQLDYLDTYFIHWPFANFHAPGCDVSARSPDAHRYIHENFMKTWRQLERLVELGLVRTIGTSNVSIAKLKLLLRDASIRPALNEMELHPHFQQPELFEFLLAEGIGPIGFSPLGSPGRPDRDCTPEDTVPLQDPVIVDIAKQHNASPAQICIKWAAQRGQVPIPFSTKHKNYVANLLAVTQDPLSSDEMTAIKNIDRRNRFIKGQVFLWKADQSWRDLWDEDGVIAT